MLTLQRVTRWPMSPLDFAQAPGADVGESCMRFYDTFVPKYPAAGTTERASFDATNTNTSIAIPIVNVPARLRALTLGSSRARPFVKLPFKANGACSTIAFSPSHAVSDPDATRPVHALSAQVAGRGPTERYSCTVEVNGYVTLRRMGAVTRR